MTKSYSIILVALLKGIIYSHNEKIWDALLQPENEIDVRKYFNDIHLDLIIDTAEGFAYLKQKTTKNNENIKNIDDSEDFEDVENTEDNDNNEIPKLIQKRQLNFDVSLMCLLLRKHMIENDRDGEFTKAILAESDIINLAKPFYKETTNEANQQKKIKAAIKKVIEEGFLRQMKTEDKQYEINRIIKAFVNADVVKDALEKLKNYTNQISDETSDETSDEMAGEIADETPKIVPRKAISKAPSKIPAKKSAKTPIKKSTKVVSKTPTKTPKRTK